MLFGRARLLVGVSQRLSRHADERDPGTDRTDPEPRGHRDHDRLGRSGCRSGVQSRGDRRDDGAEDQHATAEERPEPQRQSDPRMPHLPVPNGQHARSEHEDQDGRGKKGASGDHGVTDASARNPT